MGWTLQIDSNQELIFPNSFRNRDSHVKRSIRCPFWLFFISNYVFFYLKVVRGREIRRLKAEIVYFSKMKILATCVAFLGNKRNTCCHRRVREVQTALWEFVGNVIFSLFDLKNRFSAFNDSINIAGGRLDILFHFPNDWYNNIER